MIPVTSAGCGFGQPTQNGLYSTFQHYHTHASPLHCGSTVTNGYLLSEVKLLKGHKGHVCTCSDFLEVHGIMFYRMATVAACVVGSQLLLCVQCIMTCLHVGVFESCSSLGSCPSPRARVFESCSFLGSMPESAGECV